MNTCNHTDDLLFAATTPSLRLMPLQSIMTPVGKVGFFWDGLSFEDKAVLRVHEGVRAAVSASITPQEAQGKAASKAEMFAHFFGLSEEDLAIVMAIPRIQALAKVKIALDDAQDTPAARDAISQFWDSLSEEEVAAMCAHEGIRSLVCSAIDRDLEGQAVLAVAAAAAAPAAPPAN